MLTVRLMHGRGLRRLLAAALIVTISPTPSGVVFAESPGAAATPASSGGELSEVVVTAQHRSEREEKVPISITALQASTIESLDIRTIDKLATVTPGLTFNTGYSWTQTYIRGIGVSTAPGVGLESPVAVYIDGAYLPRNVGVILDLLDPASVEVLKGPQGTLYGRNASGGAILLNTANPTHEFSFKGVAEGGNHGHEQVDAVVNLPVNDTLAFRIASRYRNEDGFLRNITTGEEVGGKQVADLRAKVLWKASSDLTALLALDYHYEYGHANASGRQDATPPFCVGCAFGGQSATTGFYQVTEDLRRHDPGRSYNANLNLQYDFGNLAFKSITAYRDLTAQITDDSDHTSAPLFVYYATYGGKTFSEEAQVSSSYGGPINFLAGAQYIDDRAFDVARIYGAIFGLPYVGATPPANANQGRQNIRTRSFAGYAELYIKPLDPLTITLGVRYSKDRREIDSIWNQYAVMNLDPGGPSTALQRASFAKSTPRAVIAYDTGPANLYASFTRGFKAGGFNSPAFGPQTTPIEPEVIDSYEVGAKFVSADHRTRVNAAAFRYNYNNVQVSIFTASTQIIKNAGRARGNGVELDVSHRPADWLTLSGGGAYLDAKYVSYPNAAAYLLQRDAAGSIIGVAPGEEDLSNSPLPRAPKWSGYLSASLEAPLAHGWLGRLNTVIHYTSSYIFNPGAGGDLRTDIQGAYALMNLSGGVGPASGTYEVGFYIDNLTGRRYYETRAIGSLGIDAMPAAPRTYGARVTFRF